MANFITFIRLILLFVLVLSIYWADPSWQRANLPLLIFIMLLDALDGWVARKFNESSLFGAVFDIAADRIVETVLWVVLAHIGLVPIWAAIVFIVRGNLVDTIRNSMAASQGVAPFDMMKSPLGRFVVGGRFMRGFYNTAKIVTFGWVLMIQPMPVVYPDHWADISAVSGIVTMSLVWLSVILCLVRGAPVVLEFLAIPKARK
ncbi:MAG: CDP-alcohol phosphatidyltransferase family protein [Alphaproteobacteria bacterium]|jgi:CDP-diacylglycerol--glycerol-3-phosphate 3-phosphatidyltransferase|nr:CDP-alcohol phosphatidyltransferase family protein [Alphaproteobacteria bacterium]MDH5559144.1 CDP-alcohol phosphatidyltransferase family protein [Alphaproteobacteria bacterium]